MSAVYFTRNFNADSVTTLMFTMISTSTHEHVVPSLPLLAPSRELPSFSSASLAVISYLALMISGQL